MISLGRAPLFALLAVAFIASAAEPLRIRDPQLHTGMCDASAAIAVASNLFLVASDEDNVLRLYAADKPGPPVKQFDLSQFVNQHGESDEVDIEGAARIGNRAFWIGSHGLNKDGKLVPSRRCIFATDIETRGGEIVLTPIGKPSRRLLDDLLADTRFAGFQLRDAARRAPKDSDALNIEGLSATPEGHLLIGFRNPIPAGKALLIPLINPNQVIKGGAAQFGDALLLELGGLAVRDIALFEKTYIIIAGPHHGGADFRLYRWSGPGHPPEQIQVEGLNSYHPEGLVIYPHHGVELFQVLSDDGARLVDDCPCKDLKDASKQSFRSFWVSH